MVRNIPLATATINARVDAAALRRGATQSANELRRVQRQTRQLAAAQRRTNRAFLNFSRRLSLTRVALVGLAGVTGLGLVVTRTAELATGIQEAADRAGIASREYLVLQRVFEADGIAANQFNRAISQLARAANEAAQGVATYADIFDRLGVSVTDANGNLASTDVLLTRLVPAFANMNDRTEALGLATELFGNRGAAMLNTFQRGPEVFNATLMEMDDLTQVTSRQIQANKDVDQAFRNLSNVLRDTFIAAVGESADEWIKLAEELEDVARETIPTLIDGLRFTLENLDVLTEAFQLLFATIISFTIFRFGLLAAEARQAMGTVLLSVRRLTLGFGLTLGAVAALIEIFPFLVRAIRDPERAWIELQTRIGQGIIFLLQSIRRLFELVGRDVRGVDDDIQTITNSIRDLGVELEALNARDSQGARPRITRTVPITGEDSNNQNGDTSSQIDLTKQLTEATRELTSAEQFRADAAQTFTSQFTDGIVSAIEGTKSLSDAFRETARNILRDLFRIQLQQQLLGLFNPAFGVTPAAPTLGGNTSLPTASLLRPSGFQQGGYIGDGRVVRVGEAGPELVRLPSRSRVAPARREPMTTNYNFNISSTDGPGVQAALAQALPIFTQASVAAVENQGNRNQVF